MVTKAQTQTAKRFVSVALRPDGNPQWRCRANGKCKIWKTRPHEFRLPVKYGLRECFYITNDNAHQWNVA